MARMGSVAQAGADRTVRGRSRMASRVINVFIMALFWFRFWFRDYLRLKRKLRVFKYLFNLYLNLSQRYLTLLYIPMLLCDVF